MPWKSNQKNSFPTLGGCFFPKETQKEAMHCGFVPLVKGYSCDFSVQICLDKIFK